MARALFFSLLLLVLGVSSAVAQGPGKPVRVSSWVTELGAGAGLDLAARGPWMAPSWRQSAGRRVLMSLSVSLIYEYAVEPWNGYTNAAKWSDVAQRLAGTLGTEMLLGLIDRIKN